jgi:pimeloyl-ACP methyl ester carboxylesterase
VRAGATPKPRSDASYARARRGYRWTVTFFAAVLALLGAVTAAEAWRFVGDGIERGGVDAFYASPEGAVPDDPGSLIRSDELLGTPFASRAWRIMYTSTTTDGDPVVVTGVVITPFGIAPSDGRTVLAWSHPTTGAARGCAPSYGFDPFSGIEGLRLFLARGYTVVATDYAGMGVDGPDSYLVGGTEGRNVLDAVRAARSIGATQAGADVVLWGHSQGGQAALFAAEQAADYAPELDIEAVAVAAPAADLGGLMGAHLDDISGVTIGAYAFTAYAETYGDSVPGAQLADILTPEAQRIVPQMNELCLLPDLDRLHEIGEPLVGDFTIADPTRTEPWQSLFAENSAGQTAFDAPLFVAQGLSDQLIPHEITADFVAHEKSLGIDVTEHTIGIATHSTIAYLTLPALMLWLDALDL